MRLKVAAGRLFRRPAYWKDCLLTYHPQIPKGPPRLDINVALFQLSTAAAAPLRSVHPKISKWLELVGRRDAEGPFHLSTPRGDERGRHCAPRSPAGFAITGQVACVACICLQVRRWPRLGALPMTVFLFETKRELGQLARLAPDSRQVYIKHSSSPKDAHPGVQRVCRRPRPTRRIFATPRSGATDPGLCTTTYARATTLGHHEIKETCFSGGPSRLVQLFQVRTVSGTVSGC
ncbi:hypothetical protein BDP55DRAFT_164085 [Colletotrichum godetiae]|uniref:Uncharacterized protein n=1 Tax=Colletotrichum godetiae TaxID=1209918 RepID=A0AAJ0AJ94_9PEZI|nr:uncharacterized protein BDP55DRAFT_164085 [Colletotrichum godetiae]KAK1674921.1 hypothetical protein BDP55DRAFT_164085 [Colletotrichum godetiae]